MKKLLAICLTLLFTQFAFTMNGPIPPKFPTIKKPEIQNPTKSKPTKKEQNEQVEETSYPFKVEVILNKGSSTEGKIYLGQKSININNKKGDFVYKKTIAVKDISQITILEWKKRKMTKDKKAKNIMYLFYPSKFNIATKDGNDYDSVGRLAQFEKFYLTNDMGKTTVYSIFYDYWTKTGAKTQWYHSKSNEFNKITPNPLALKKIIFRSDDKK